MTKRRDAIIAQLASLRDVVAGFGPRTTSEDPGKAAREAAEAAEHAERRPSGPSRRPSEAQDAAEETPSSPSRATCGEPGDPLKHSPFYVGFFGAAGAVLAFWLGQQILAIGSVLILIVVSLFLAAGLNPLVEWFERRGLRRSLRRARGHRRRAGRGRRSSCSRSCR